MTHDKRPDDRANGDMLEATVEVVVRVPFDWTANLAEKGENMADCVRDAILKVSGSNTTVSAKTTWLAIVQPGSEGYAHGE